MIHYNKESPVTTKSTRSCSTTINLKALILILTGLGNLRSLCYSRSDGCLWILSGLFGSDAEKLLANVTMKAGIGFKSRRVEATVHV